MKSVRNYRNTFWTVLKYLKGSNKIKFLSFLLLPFVLDSLKKSWDHRSVLKSISDRFYEIKRHKYYPALLKVEK